MLAKRKRVLRSPTHSSRPETRNSTANAAVSIAFTFCPTLKRLGRNAVEVARGAQQPAPVAEERDDRDRRQPAHAGPEVDVLQERPPSEQHLDARDVEREPGDEQEQERGRVHPVQRALGAREALDVPHDL